MGNSQQNRAVSALPAWHWGALLFILLVAAGLAARGLNADLLFVDEYWSIRNSGGAYFGPLGPLDIWQTMARIDPGGMGMFYHWLLAGWFALVGSSIFALRVFSLLCGVLAIAATYQLGKTLFSRNIGLYAAALFGISAFYVDYMHEGRAYTLLALVACITIRAYWRITTMRRAPRFADYALLAGSITALAYTHYVALALGGVLGVWHLAAWIAPATMKYSAKIVPFPNRNPAPPLEPLSQGGAVERGSGRVDMTFGGEVKRWLYTLFALILGGLLFLPWLGITIEVARRGAGETTRQLTAMNAAQLIDALVYTLSSNNAAFLLLLLAFAVFVRNRASGLVWAWLLLVVGVTIIVNAAIPFMVHPRYLMLVFPAAALLMGIGVDQLTRRNVSAGIVLGIWVLVAVWQVFNPAFMHGVFGHIYRAPAVGVDMALDMLQDRAQPDHLTLFHIAQPGYEPFEYFPLEYYMHAIPGRADQLERMNNSFEKGDNPYLNDVLTSIGDAPFVWTVVVPEIPTTNLTQVTRYALNTYYATCGILVDRPDGQMTLYAKPPVESATITFTANEPVGLYTLMPPTLHGDQLEVTLGWTATINVPPVYSVGLHVYDAQDNLVAQADAGLPERRPFGCQHFALDAASLPAGEYNVFALVYHWETGERLPIVDTEDDKVQIGTITIKD